MALFSAKKNTAKDSAAEKEKTPVSMQELYNEPAKPSRRVESKKSSTRRPSVSHNILIKPLVTEKASNLGAENKYVFVVAAGANKIDVAKAVSAVFGVTPTKVNLINYDGKKVTRGRVRGQRKDWKKAIVTLAKGESIKVYEGV